MHAETKVSFRTNTSRLSQFARPFFVSLTNRNLYRNLSSGYLGATYRQTDNERPRNSLCYANIIIIIAIIM